MLPRLVLSCFVAVSMSATAFCITPADDNSGLSAVQHDVETLKTQVEGLTQIIQANAVAVGDLTAQMKQLSDRAAKNAQDIQVLADVQQNQNTQIGQIATLGKNGKLHWRFDAKKTKRPGGSFGER